MQFEDLNYRADLLESYIQRRGANLPAGFMQQKVFLVSRDCRYGVACIIMCQCCEFGHAYQNKKLQYKFCMSGEHIYRRLCDTEA
jgi:hypothetical protein